MDYQIDILTIRKEYGTKTANMAVIVDDIVHLNPKWSKVNTDWANAVAKDMQNYYNQKVIVHTHL